MPQASREQNIITSIYRRTSSGRGGSVPRTSDCIVIFVVLTFAVATRSQWYISLRTLFCLLSSVSWFPCESPLFRVMDTHTWMLVFQHKNVYIVSYEFIVWSECERVYPISVAAHTQTLTHGKIQLEIIFFLRSNEKSLWIFGSRPMHALNTHENRTRLQRRRNGHHQQQQQKN